MSKDQEALQAIAQAIQNLEEELTAFDKDECPDWQETINLSIKSLKLTASMIVLSRRALEWQLSKK